MKFPVHKEPVKCCGRKPIIDMNAQPGSDLEEHAIYCPQCKSLVISTHTETPLRLSNKFPLSIIDGEIINELIDEWNKQKKVK